MDEHGNANVWELIKEVAYKEDYGRGVTCLWTGLYDSTKLEDLTEQERSLWSLLSSGNDKPWKGVKIYQDDIIFHGGVKSIVRWDQDECRFILRTVDDIGAIPLLKCNQQHYTVIGNIHDQPEMADL